MMATMKPKISTCNQDDPSSVAAMRKVEATGFIQLNALRPAHGITAKVQKNK